MAWFDSLILASSFHKNYQSDFLIVCAHMYKHVPLGYVEVEMFSLSPAKTSILSFLLYWHNYCFYIVDDMQIFSDTQDCLQFFKPGRDSFMDIFVILNILVICDKFYSISDVFLNIC